MRIIGTALAMILFCVFSFSSLAQTVSIARWKNNAQGAYSICHDDFPWNEGLWKYADTIAYNRGIPLATACVVSGMGSAEWQLAARLVAHGHEIVAHTWDHTNPLEWNPSQYPLQIDSVKAVMDRNLPSQECLFYVPCNRTRPEGVITYLRTTGYIGARAGAEGINPYLLPDPFLVRWVESNVLETLNSRVDETIGKAGWAYMTMHGVQDASWTSMPLNVYHDHLVYLKQKIDAGALWVGTPSNVIRYIRERENFGVTIASKGAGVYSVTFRTVNLQPKASLFNYPLTLLAQFPGGIQNVVVKQDGKVLPHKIASNSTVQFDALPYGGTVEISTGVTTIEKRIGLSKEGVKYMTARQAGSAVELTLLATASREVVLFSIYGIDGRHVSVLPGSADRGNRYRVIWDGTDENGAKTAYGTYLCRARAADGSRGSCTFMIK